MQYEIILKPSAQKDLDNLPDKDVPKIFQHIKSLSFNPRPIGSQKLTDKGGFRIRSGHYRILYEIDDHAKVVLI